MFEASRQLEIADGRRRLADRFPDWFPAMSAARQDALAEMHSEMGPADAADLERVIRHAGRGEHHTASAAMLLSAWATRSGQRAWRIAAAMRTGEAAPTETAH
jgi:hypothetical protein